METGVHLLKMGQTGVIQHLLGEEALQHRLAEMGFTKGTPVTVKRAAPFGGPLQLEVRGYRLMVRKKDAQKIVVKTER